MTTMTASMARAGLFQLLRKVAKTHEPIQITGKESDAVLISAEDWRAVQETLYLLSVSGMRKSIREGLKTPVSKCKTKLDW